MSENLSETLFAHTFNVQETSTLIANSATKKNHKQNDVVMEGEQKPGWYRL
ncbi:MAG: esterase FrsA, partial [Psychromonas sp.]